MLARGTILSNGAPSAWWILLAALMVATRLLGQKCSAFVPPAFTTASNHLGLTASQQSAAFTINKRHTGSTRPRIRSSFQLQAEKQSETEYIDDCFGLIFLASSFVAQDAIFSVSFVALSAIALVATRANQIQLPVSAERKRRVVPAVVAAATLLLTPVLEILIAPVYTQELDDKARLIELAVCAVSVVYGFLSEVEDA